MKKIIELPQQIISKVAAGEVIEAPASVVKELIENSIDAGATKIVIEVEKGGLEKIRVIDNGEGMSKGDLEICYKRYTTSKLSEDDFDLSNIFNLGFRGEALYSIATVSDITIQSKIPEALAGYEIKISGGIKIQDTQPLGMPNGTIVTVTNIFFNTPARKNFLGDPGVEFKAVVQSVQEIATGYPHIGFVLKNNNKTYMHLPQGQDVISRLRYLFGEDLANNLVQIHNGTSEEDVFKYNGFISKPQNAYPTKDMQFLFANKRYIEHKTITDSIKASYGTLIENKLHPAIVLDLEIPSSRIDVNIHPKKRRIRFLDEDSLLESISANVKKTLGITDMTYKIGRVTYGPYATVNTSIEEDIDFIVNDKKSNKYLAQVLKEKTQAWNIKTDSPRSKYEEVLQIHNLYLLVEIERGLLVVDQHAAHERILYEQFLAQFLIEKDKKETIDVEMIIELPYKLAPLMDMQKENLEKVGFEIEGFGSNSFNIRKIPKIFEKHNMHTLIIELLTDLAASEKNFTDIKSLKTISYLACRSAIKAGDYLTQEERKNLLTKLENTKTNYTCPHGRPVKMEITLRELSRLFKRT